jgi:Fe-S oxidoreductase
MTEAESKTEKLKKKRIDTILNKIKNSVNYCFNCNRCVNVCPLAHLDIFSPRRLINDLAFLSLKEALENNNIWLCLSCGQCNVYCPMTKEEEGVNIPGLIRDLRILTSEDPTETERMAQCETHDGIFPLLSRFQANNPSPPNKLDFLENSTLKTSKTGEIAFFVGCLPIMNEVLYRLDVDYIQSAKAIIGLLNEGDITPVVLNEKCCGHDLLWGKADIDTFKKLARYNVSLYKDAGVKTIIFSCAEGYRTWKYDYPKYVDDFDFEIIHFTEFMLENKILENIRFPANLDIKVTYHDPCRLGRLGGHLYDAPRTILERIPGVELIEMENIKEDARCCGVSTFSNCNEYTRILRKNRIQEAIDTGAEYLLVSCPKCLSHFNCYLKEPSLDKNQKELKNKIKVMDMPAFIGTILYYF